MVFNQLAQKSSKFQQLEIDTKDRQQENNTTTLWHSRVLLDQIAIGQGALDLNKKTSQAKAVLLFFKAFFPASFTWLDLVAFVQEKEANPIERIRQRRHQV